MNQKIIENDTPLIADEVELDCEAHQAIRKSYCFYVGNGDENSVTYCANVTAKMCKENDTHAAYAYIDNGDEASPDYPTGISYGSTGEDKFLPLSKRMADALINEAKRMITEDFEKMRKKEREYEQSL